jgi:hypothetical protein
MLKMNLRSTKNYDLFRPSDFNRDIGNIDSLVLSMKTHGYIPAYPLHCVQGVDGKMVVKAGHHRLEAAKRLGIAVYYVITNDSASIDELERASKAWRLSDYVKSFARQGSSDYLAILEWQEKSGIAMKQIVSMLAGEQASSGNSLPKVKTGTFVVKDELQIRKVATIVNSVRKEGLKWATDNQFVSALSQCVFLPEFEHAKFIEKAVSNRHALTKQGTKDQYLDMIESVYNSHRKERIPLAFLAKEAAKKRNVVGKKKQVSA